VGTAHKAAIARHLDLLEHLRWIEGSECIVQICMLIGERFTEGA